MIHWWDDGVEHDEEWDSVDGFCSWCASEGIAPSWRAYQQDEDGDWVPFAQSPG